ncbi:MAG: hypothetical protein KAX19_14675 [Candidatus Brocadiae bacterium]|nr:hypothetical protein [Candidatus Brocadiia bacterium]
MKQLLFTAGILALGLLAGAILVHGQAPDWDPSRMLVPGVRCLDAEQDLGELWQTDSLELEFHLVNESGEDTFEVGPIRGGYACTSVTPEKVTMSPGDEVTVKATVDLERYRFPASGPKEFTETVLAIAKDPFGEKFALRMAARGLVRPSYRIEPEAVSFGTIFRPDTPAVSAEVECVSPTPLQGLEILSAPEGLNASVERLPGEANAFRLTVRAAPDIAYGALKERIRFRAQLASGPFVTRSVAVRGRVVDDLYALPPILLFGTLAAGDECSLTVRLLSRSQEPFVVERVETIHQALEVQPRELSSSTAHTCVVSFRPTAPGALSESVKFKLRTRAGREHTVELPVRAYAASFTIR